ncbi:autotransporter outer membrane beta-barrel domain-containing protein [Bradyrhizobium sp. SRS-191]|uniref:autotransporter family protein n=1 Tax=Bradyrhizobium sp. SRS-191 TaxID=2962606 RepID=UPI00211EE9D9|nr:autotransporter outer membrane beta-barrel domain-containing protein [Bradyrhizobium sp. SRS-191]
MKSKNRKRGEAAAASFVLLSTWMVAGEARAECTTPGITVTCSGTISTAVTVYDAAAATATPSSGSNAYTPANPAFPATGYNPNPPTAVITLDSTAVRNLTTNSQTGLADRGMIAANFSNAEDPAVNNVVINNAGWLSLTTSQLSAGRLHVIVADSQVNKFTVNNTGTLAATQNFFGTFDPTKLSVSIGATATARYNGTNLAIISALYSDDNTNSVVVNNRAGGTISATGNYAAAYYGRADTTITNSGTIANTSWTSASRFYDGHWAIGAFAGAEFDTIPGSNPDSPLYKFDASGNVTVTETKALTLTNTASGVIKGDILALDTNPLTTAAGLAAGSTFPLTGSGSNSGPRDSVIANAGLIQGNLYLGSGEHDITNSGTISGSISVDQSASRGSFAKAVDGTVAGTYRSTGTGSDAQGNACPSAGTNTTDPLCASSTSQAATFFGARTFNLVNTGKLGGDIVINDQDGANNTILLKGSGFSGNVVAQNGLGSNALTLDGVTSLASIVNFGTLDLMKSQVTMGAGGVQLVDGAVLRTTIFGPGGTAGVPSTNIGNITGTVTFAGAGTVAPTLQGIVRNGDVYRVATAVSATPLDVDFSSALVGFVADTSTGALLLNASVRSPATIAGISPGSLAALNGLFASTGGNAQVQALGGAVQSLGTDREVRNAADQLRPFVNGAQVQVPLSTASLFQNQIDNRLTAAAASPNSRVASAFASETDPLSSMLMAYGATKARPALKAPAIIPEPERTVWGSLIGTNVSQHDVAGVAGYTGNTGGLVAGIDQRIDAASRIGAAFGYATSSMDDRTAAGDAVGMQHYQGTVYGAYVQPSWYVNGSAGIALVDYTTTRRINFAGFTDTAAGSHKGWLTMVRGEFGMPIRVDQAVLTPFAGITYARLDQQAYTETSAAGAALAVARQTTNSVRSNLGLRSTVPLLVTSTYGFGLETLAAWRHEFGSTAQNVTASFAGGGATFFAAGPSPERNLAELGAALKLVAFGERQSISLGYNAVVGSQYLEQSAVLKVRAEF